MNSSSTSDRFALGTSFALVLIPAVRFGFAGITLLPEHLAILILGVVWLRRRGQRANVTQAHNPTLFVILLLLLLWWLFTAASSLFAAPSPTQSLRLQAWVLANIILACQFVALRSLFMSMIDILVAIVVVYMVIGLIGWLIAQTAGELNLLVERDYASSVFRLNAFFDEPNLYAGFLTLFTCVLIGWRQSIDQRLVWIYLVIGSVSIYFTFTRAAWITWAAAGVVLGAWMLRKNWAAASLLAIGGVAAMLLAVYSGSGTADGAPLIDATSRRLGELINFDTGTGMTRTLTIESAFADLTQHNAWLSGFGFNSYGQMHESGVTSYAAAYLPTLWAALIYDGGWLGASCFMLAAVLVWWETRRIGGTLFFVCFAILTSATNNIWFSFPWVLTAMLVGAAQLRYVAPWNSDAVSREVGPPLIMGSRRRRASPS